MVTNYYIIFMYRYRYLQYTENMRYYSAIHAGARAPRRTYTYTYRYEYRGWMCG
jgi:hypothetical protein